MSDGRSTQRSCGFTESLNVIDGRSKSAIKVLNNEVNRLCRGVRGRFWCTATPLAVPVKDHYSNSDYDSPGVKGLTYPGV